MVKSASAIMKLKSHNATEGDDRKPRGADLDRREAIMAVAEDVFLEHGFQAASMSQIAARAGGSKGTLYNYFANKEDLFFACIARHCEVLRADMSSLLAGGGGLEETLACVGRRYVEMVASDAFVRRFRMVVAEAERAPEITRAFYETGPARGAEIVAGYLEEAMARGMLRRADPRRAANQFLALCNSHLWKARLCDYTPAPPAKEVECDVQDAVRVFLAAYRAG